MWSLKTCFGYCCKWTLKGRRSNPTLFSIISICLAIYLSIQIATLLGVLPIRRNSNEYLFGKERPQPTPYISFLGAVASPNLHQIDQDCIRELQKNHSFMSSIEVLLPNSNSLPNLITYLNKKLLHCVNGTEKTESIETLIARSMPSSSPEPKTKSATEPDYQFKTCLEDVANLKRVIALDLTMTPPKFTEIAAKYPQLTIGGNYPGPKFCRPRYSVAIIIPYRDRNTHLRFWLYYTLGTLIKQQIQFTVFVAEQFGDGVFNKGQLMNTAFQWITTEHKGKFQCFVFHDVDMIPEVAANVYKCTAMRTVMHLSPLVDKFNYTLRRKTGVTVGGAVSFTEWQYRAVNGYSNVYWGWGGEDDDMNLRIRYLGLRRIRPGVNIGRYKMIRHRHDQLNPLNTKRHRLLKQTRASMFQDGLSSLNTTVITVMLLPTHTHLLIRISEHIKPQIEKHTTPSP